MGVLIDPTGMLKTAMIAARAYNFIQMAESASLLSEHLHSNGELPDLSKLSKTEQRQLIHAACRFYEGHGVIP